MIPWLYVDFWFAWARAAGASWLTVLPPGIYPPRREPESQAEPAPVERMPPRLRLVSNRSE